MIRNSLLANQSLALVYLARGADNDCVDKFSRFAQSYLAVPAGVEHSLFIIFKGFENEDAINVARRVFEHIIYQEVRTSDDKFDIGAYADSLQYIGHEKVCFLNTNSEILGANWLAKLAVNLDVSSVGLVSATGSFESLYALDSRFPAFPNVHLRTNAFMMRRSDAVRILNGFLIKDKRDAFFAESGPQGLTRKIFEMGYNALIVGRDGRGYLPQYWAFSNTFRQGTQSNLLVHDNVTRTFDALAWEKKRIFAVRSWGHYLSEENVAILPRRILVDNSP